MQVTVALISRGIYFQGFLRLQVIPIHADLASPQRGNTEYVIKIEETLVTFPYSFQFIQTRVQCHYELDKFNKT